MQPALQHNSNNQFIPPIGGKTMALRTDYTTNYRGALSSSFPIENLPDYQKWSCSQWIDFHERLATRYGKANANLVWNEFWNNKPHGWLGDKCIGLPDFVSYFKKQGIMFNPNFYSYVSDGKAFLSSLPKNIRTVVIGGMILGGIAVAAYLGYQIYTAIQVRNIAMGGLKKAANNPELVGKGIGAGLKGGI